MSWCGCGFFRTAHTAKHSELVWLWFLQDSTHCKAQSAAVAVVSSGQHTLHSTVSWCGCGAFRTAHTTQHSELVHVCPDGVNFYLSVAARKLVRAERSLRCTSILLGREASRPQTKFELQQVAIVCLQLSLTTWLRAAPLPPSPLLPPPLHPSVIF